MGFRLVEPSSFLANPVGACVVRRGFLTWCGSRTLHGSIFWGIPDIRDAEDLAGIWDFDRGFERFDSIIDISRVKWVDPVGFPMVVAYLARRVDDYAAHVRRHALLVPPEDVGGAAMIAGVPTLLGFRNEWRVFKHLAPAIEWLERPDAPDFCRDAAALAEEAMAADETIALLRNHLAAHPKDASLEDVSRAIGRSSRSLQRDLQASRSSFRDELRLARVRAAAELLATTDLKLEAVAAEVGYKSLTHFNEAFEAVLGKTPSQFRTDRKR